MKVIDINPTPILVTKSAVTLSNDQIEFLHSSDKISMNGVLVSANDNILYTPELESIRAEIERVCNVYFHEVYGASKDVYLKVTTSSYAKTDSGMSQNIHKHTNSLIAGCMYIKKPKNAPLKILCNQPLFKDFNFEFPYSNETIYNQGLVSVDAEENDIVLFPGHLFHYVDNQNNEEREVIGFSAFVFGDFNKARDNWSRYHNELSDGYGTDLRIYHK